MVQDGCSEHLAMHVWATPGHSSHRTCPPAPAWHKVTHQNEGLLKRWKPATRSNRQDAFSKAFLQICKPVLDYCQGAVVKESLQITCTLGQL